MAKKGKNAKKSGRQHNPFTTEIHKAGEPCEEYNKEGRPSTPKTTTGRITLEQKQNDRKSSVKTK